MSAISEKLTIPMSSTKSIRIAKLRHLRREYLRVLEMVIPDLQQRLHANIASYSDEDEMDEELRVWEGSSDWSREHCLENWMHEYFLVEKGWATPGQEDWFNLPDTRVEDSVINVGTYEEFQYVATFQYPDLTFDFLTTSVADAQRQAHHEFDRQWKEFVATLPSPLQKTGVRKRGRPRKNLEIHMRWFAQFQQDQQSYDKIAKEAKVRRNSVIRAIERIADVLRIKLRTEYLSGRAHRYRPLGKWKRK